MKADSADLRTRVPGGGEYEVRIAPGVLDEVAARASEAAPAHRYAIVHDSQVARLYGDRIASAFGAAGLPAESFTFPAGEWNKSREEWARLSDALLAAGFGRDSAVVAVGGGVTGDLAGFVAATYMRGVPVVQVPTTLLAMLDSSVGGKTGVDTESGKNLVGAFHHPALVLIDPEVLASLPRHQRIAGLAEAVKTAAILDAELWEWIVSTAAELVEGDVEVQTRLVRAVVAHKIDIVTADPHESDLRAILNFGHTIGHALETLEGYTLLHGEAVAAGMRAEARLGERAGVTEPGTSGRIAEALDACGLDRAWEAERRADEVMEALGRDKKARGRRPRCVFLRRIGEVATDPEGRHTFALEPEALEASLAAALRPASHA